jgi:hypothetical protein
MWSTRSTPYYDDATIEFGVVSYRSGQSATRQQQLHTLRLQALKSIAH